MLKIYLLLLYGVTCKYANRFTIQVKAGKDEAQRIADKHRMDLNLTPFPDLFVLSVPSRRSKRDLTSKPRKGIIRRLNVN